MPLCMDTYQTLDLDVSMVGVYNPGIATTGECPRAPGYRAKYFYTAFLIVIKP